MKKRMILAATLVTAILIGCTPMGVSRKKTSEKEHEEDTRISQPARYEPSGSVQYTFLDTLNKGNEITLEESDFHKEPAPVSNVVFEQPETAVRYKIQLFASSQIETIREQKREAEAKLKTSLSISFESPYYKLLAGNYAQRSEAELQLKKIKNLGYTDAWIVSGKPAN